VNDARQRQITSNQQPYKGRPDVSPCVGNSITFHRLNFGLGVRITPRRPKPPKPQNLTFYGTRFFLPGQSRPSNRPHHPSLSKRINALSSTAFLCREAQAISARRHKPSAHLRTRSHVSAFPNSCRQIGFGVARLTFLEIFAFHFATLNADTFPNLPPSI
jgi:hypothetical protein